MLAEHAPLVGAVGADVCMDLFGSLTPAGGAVAVPTQLGQLGAPIGRDPAHHLGANELLGRAPHLPDALIGLLPVGQRRLDLASDHGPQALVEAVTGPGVQVDRVDEDSPRIVLALIPGPVSNAHRSGALIAGEMIEDVARSVAVHRRCRT